VLHAIGQLAVQRAPDRRSDQAAAQPLGGEVRSVESEAVPVQPMRIFTRGFWTGGFAESVTFSPKAKGPRVHPRASATTAEASPSAPGLRAL
jgi:hypothetical protein